MKSMRKRLSGLVLILTGGLLLAASQTAAADSQASNLAITIAVRNYAGVDNDTLEKDERVATQIFREAGVEARWVDLALTPEDQLEASTHPHHSFQIQLGIIPSEMAGRLHLPNNVMGFAPGADPARQVVYVFYSSVEALAERQKVARIKGNVRLNATKAQILATMIAHEIGHVLLNLPSHSATGIMRGNWDLKDLEDVACGCLLFTPQQAEVIRAEVVRRLGQRKAVEVGRLESTVQTMPIMLPQSRFSESAKRLDER